MLRKYLLPFAAALMALPIYLARVDANPLVVHEPGIVASPSAVQPVAYRGRAAVGPHGGVAVRGPHGGVAVRGGVHHVGHRYYGGTWYGTGRRFYNGRWWAYGVGTCWKLTPIGYVWICG